MTRRRAFVYGALGGLSAFAAVLAGLWAIAGAADIYERIFEERHQ